MMRSVTGAAGPAASFATNGSRAAIAAATSPTLAAASVMTTMSASGPDGRCSVSLSFIDSRFRV
jgi:hypothetical protein